MGTLDAPELLMGQDGQECPSYGVGHEGRFRLALDLQRMQGQAQRATALRRG